MNLFQPMQMNMQNQFMNVNTHAIEEIIQPFKEKIKKLEEELMKKDIEIAKLNYTILQMNQMNNQFNLMNNQFIPMNERIMPNFPMFNPMFAPGNQMNMYGNTNMSPITKKTKRKIKRINLKFKDRRNNEIYIQCKSNEKMEEIINKFCVKTGIEKEGFKFIVNGNKVKMNLTIDKNGINNEDQVIYVQEKDEIDYIEEKNKKNIMEEKNDDSDYEYEDEDEDNKEICNDIIIDNVKILGEKIILIFENLGREVDIEIGMNNNFNDAAIKFGAKNKISTSNIKKNYQFIFHSKLLDIENRQTLKEIGFKNGNKITVFEKSEVIGA